MYRSVSEYFANLWHENHAKLVFRGWMHYSGVSNFRKKLCHKRIQSNLLDPKWCLWVFWRISQIFDTRIMQKFCLEQIQSNRFDPKWCLGVFQRILQTFGTKIHAQVVFRGWKHYSGVPNFRKKFCHERIQSNILDRKRCLGVFRSISQIFGKENHAKLMF